MVTRRTFLVAVILLGVSLVTVATALLILIHNQNVRAHARDIQVTHIDQGICLAIDTLDVHPATDPAYVLKVRADVNCPVPSSTVAP